MKKYSTLWSLLLLSLLLTVNVQAANGHQKGNNGVAVEKPKKVRKAQKAIPGQYIVILSGTYVAKSTSGPTKQPLDSILARKAGKYGAKVRKTWRHAVKGMLVKMSRKQAELLAQDADIALVEEDGIISLDAVQSPVTWGLDRIDQVFLPLDNSYTYNADGSGVTAYVIDTGIRITHQEFGGRASGGFTAINDGLGTSDCDGHGTHVAGTIGSASYGVAKNVQLVAVRVLDCFGNGTLSGVISGVDWVTGQSAFPAVANMSLSGGVSTAMDTAVVNSINAGVSYVVAAGNQDIDACLRSPARVAPAITIGASDINDIRAYFSNYGTCMDVFAPGVGILSLGISSDTDTALSSGTSMSSPHVAGVAALYLSVFPTATPAEVANQLLTNSSPDLIADPGPGSPNLLIYSGFISGDPGDTIDPVVNLLQPTDRDVLGGDTVLLASASDNVGVTSVNFYAGSLLLGAGIQRATDLYYLLWDTTSLNNGDYAITARAADAAGNLTTSLAANVNIDNFIASSCPNQSQLIVNSGFETGSAVPWLVSDVAIIDNSSFPGAYQGLWKARLNGYGTTHTDYLYQQVTIPVDACLAELNFMLLVNSLETIGTTNDILSITIRDTSGNVLATLAEISERNQSAAYQLWSLDLSGYKGMTVQIHFQGVENETLATSFLIDNVRLDIKQ